MFTIRGHALILTSIAIVMAPPASAAVGKASLDWSALELSVRGIGSGPAPAITFFSQQTDLSSTASDSGVGSETNTASVFNWTLPADTRAGFDGSALAFAEASPLTLSGDAQAHGTAASGWFLQSQTSGSRSAGFFLDGPGVLTVSIPFAITADGSWFDFYNSASASVSGQASFSSPWYPGGSFANGSASRMLDTWYYGPGSESGNLVFGIVASGPGDGSLSFSFGASAQASVSAIPEPETYALMLAGLGLVGLAARRRWS